MTALNPECQQGKHPNCDGNALHQDNTIGKCECDCHEQAVDTCRVIEVDGEDIRVQGKGVMSNESKDAIAEVVRAVRRRMSDDEKSERRGGRGPLPRGA